MLKIDVQRGVTRLTLDRAERGNSLSAELVDELLVAVTTACSSAETHTLVLAATGPHFCTGFDLSDLDTCSEGDLLLRFVRIEMLLATLWSAPIHTVAVAQGRCWGAGADLFAACERRLVAADGNFRFPGAGFGLVLGTRRLGERVGADVARQWVIEGQEVGVLDALRVGLATERFDDPPVEEALAQVGRVDRLTAARLRAVTRPDCSDSDLAALVRSASTPGIKARIADYRSRLRAASSKSSPS